MSNRLPHQPETIEAMQARYPAALERVIDRRDAMTDLRRSNIFDFTDGLRLVVTMEFDRSAPPPGLMLHVWSWAQPGSRVMGWITTGMFRRSEHFALYARRRFKELTGVDLPDKCWLSPTIGIPHWFVPHKVKSPAAEVVAGK